ncbi:Alpha/Beta hydrolase protein [Dipodascopsis tothii]|uniref:Alpha/Beta hydrolase protein n=1 Tax=Dipodascopsis tothii TaxID=44089 RepID=UPI0034CD6589
MTETCDNTPIPKLTVDYTPRGTTSTLFGHETYMVGNPTAKHAIICIYDVFGVHPNTYQSADYFALDTPLAPLVVMPDFFDGEPVTAEMFGQPELRDKWRADHRPARYVDDVKALVKYLTTEKGIESVGVYGFCWGAKLAMSSAPGTAIGGVAIVHPSAITVEDTVGIEATPMLIIATKGEDDAVYSAVAAAFSDCKYVRFDDMHHGFCAARGDWSVEAQRTRAQEAMTMMSAFFSRVLTA